MILFRALISFLVLPGLFGFLLPPVIARLDPLRSEGLTFGYGVMAMGAMVLLWCVRDFLVSGRGTLAPWDPPKRLVVVGLYRSVRNPMYLGVLTLVLGWALTTGSPVVAFYDAGLFLGFHIRVKTYEEPWLAGQFAAQWKEYAAEVPRWLPRLKPWKGRID
jgi:protein-S-isoprenylcysteine O-methyltransferase Ste14